MVFSLFHSLFTRVLNAETVKRSCDCVHPFHSFWALVLPVRTAKVLDEFRGLYEQQYTLALFNKVRYDVEGGGGPQPQLLHRKVIIYYFITSHYCNI